MAMTDADWDYASKILNTYADQANGAGQTSINWDAAKKLFEQYAASGRGNLGDWINQTFENRTQWMGGGTPAELADAARRSAEGYNSTGAGPRFQGGGVSTDKWSDPKHQTLKYQVLRIADEVPPAQLRAQFEAGSGAQYDKIKAMGFAMDRDGKISRADLGPKPIDIIHGDNSEYGWRDENHVKAPPKGISPPGISPPGGGISPPGPGNKPGGKTGGIDPAYLAPWTEAFQGVAPMPTWNYADFQAPDANGVYADKGYDFRVQQGLQGLKQGAAALGQLRTGSTMKGLIDYGQAAASQEYPNVFNRALTAYTTNRGTSQGAYDTQAAKNSADYSRALQDYQQRYNIFRNNQNDPWAKLQDLARLGQNAAVQK